MASGKFGNIVAASVGGADRQFLMKSLFQKGKVNSNSFSIQRKTILNSFLDIKRITPKTAIIMPWLCSFLLRFGFGIIGNCKYNIHMTKTL